MKLKPLWAALVICSIFCLPRLVLHGACTVSSNRILIRIPAAGLSAAQVSDCIEPVVNDSLSGLTKEVSLQSICRPGELLMAASFSPDYPSVDMLTRIQRQLFTARSHLPYQAGLPLLIPFDSTAPFLCLAVDFSEEAHPQGQPQIKLEAEQLQEELRRSGLLRRASVLGIADHELALFLDREKLVQREISPQYIAAYLQQCLFNYYAGNWQNRRYSFGVNICSSIVSAQKLEQLRIPLPVFAGRPKTLVLEDIAEIESRILPPRHRIFGGDVLISIYTSPEIQIQQQIALYTQLCTTLKKNDAIDSWQLCGGHFYFTLRLCALYTAQFCAGLLLTLYLCGQFSTPLLTGITTAASAARLYTLVWSLILLWHALGQWPCTFSTCTGGALALPLTLLVFSLRRMPVGRPPAIRNLTLSAPLSATWVICAILTAALLLRAFMLLPQPRILSIDVPSEQQAAVYFRACSQQIEHPQNSRKGYVCGMLSVPHEFSRTENAQEYWESCARPWQLEVKYLATPLKELCSPSPSPHSSTISDRPIRRRLQQVPFAIDLKPSGHDPAPVTRREVHSQIDLALNGRVVGTLHTGAARHIPVRLFYGRPSPSERNPWHLKQFPIFIDERRAIRLEQLCRLHISKGSFKQ